MIQNTDDIVQILQYTIFHWSFGPILALSGKLLGLNWSSALIQIGSTHLMLWIISKVIYEILQQPKGYKGKPLNLRGKVVLITGGATGLGKSIVHKLNAKGAIVAVLDVAPLDYQLDNVHYFKCNVLFSEDIKKVINDVVEKVGKPTILINNAGVVKTADTFDKIPEEEIDMVLGINLNAPMHFCRQILPMMIEQEVGHIVNIASILGHVAPAFLGTYCASKSGLIGAHESIRNDLMMYYPNCSIKTTLVMPGKLSSKLFEKAVHPSYFLLPVQDIEPLAEKIVKELEIHRHNEIMAPKYAYLTPYYRIFNVTFRTGLINSMKFNQAMLNFNTKSK